MSLMQYTYEDLYNRVSKFLGTYGNSGPTGTDLTDAQDFVQEGYQNFIAAAGGYVWSFLKKYSTLSTESGKYSYDLPEDYVSMIIPFRFTQNTGYPPVTERSEDEIMELRNYNSISSWPQYYAIRAGSYTPQAGQKYEVIFWPQPDAEFVLYYQYKMNPPALSNATDLPIGGPEMASCLLKMCLAAAEGEADEELSVQSQRAMEALAKALDTDKERTPRRLGQNSAYAGLTAWDVARGSTRVNDVNYNV